MWHITFSRALTAYIFIPLTRALGRQLVGNRKAVTALSYLATFGFCGYWHGPTPNFVAWGLYHAVGLIANDYFRTWAMQRRLVAGRTQAKGATALGIRVVSTAGTFAYVSLGWTWFVLPLEWVF